jgi:hypothetical protein
MPGFKDSFARRFEAIRDRVILPTVKRVVIQHALDSGDARPVSFRVVPGGMAQTTDGDTNRNQRVSVRGAREGTELSFVAWDPYVLVSTRCNGFSVRHHTPEEITPRLVEHIAERFLHDSENCRK